jgi:CHAT domain-containing protein
MGPEGEDFTGHQEQGNRPPSGKEQPRNKQKPASAKRHWPVWGRVVTALALVALIVTVVVRSQHSSVPNDLLANAYTERRTIELRISGARHAAMIAGSHTEGLRQNMPLSLLKAESMLARDAQKHREDPRWLQSEARAALLEWDYETATRMIEDALSLQPEDPELLVDRATAFYEQGMASQPHGTFYFGQAINDLGEALRKKPGNSLALFNRAILYEASFLPHEAITDLVNYLALDPSGEWAGEASARLSRLSDKVKSLERARTEPLANAQMFVEISNDPGKAASLDDRIEEYLGVAITDWLPEAFPAKAENGRNLEALAALRALGKILAEKHTDAWLNDLIGSASHPQEFGAAVQWLSNAVTFSARGEEVKARDAAERAGSWFARADSQPGVLRARIEQIYALRNAHQAKRCIAEASAVSQALKKTNYGWMRTQLFADTCSCLLMTGEFDQGRKHAADAIQEASNFRYPVLRLRSLGMAASVESDEGNLLEAWEENESGLAEYWRAKFAPPRRAQQFYDDLSYAAENTGELNLALSLGRESVQLSVIMGDRIFEAMTRQHLAQIAVKVGELRTAQDELRISSEILKPLAKERGMQVFLVAAESGLAEIESQLGDTTRAEQHLNNVRAEIGGFQSFEESRDYYKAQAAVLKKQKKLDAAENVLRRAIQEADEYLSRLSDDHSRYLWTEENAGLYRSLVDVEMMKEDPRAALTAWEWYRAGLSGARSKDVDSFESLLRSQIIDDAIAGMHDRSLISYAVLPQRLAMWVVDESGLHSQFMPLDAGTLRVLAVRFSDMCADPASDRANLRRAGQKLFQMLLQPLPGRSPLRRFVTIEADDPFDDISFQALSAPDGKYFGEDHVISMSSGMLDSEHHGARRAFTTRTRTLFVGSTATPPDVSGLPPINPAEEVRAASAMFSKPRVLLGRASSAPRIQQALPDSEIVHFAGHALATSRSEGIAIFASPDAGSDVVLWNAGHVPPKSFDRCRLVVLSACSTGRGYRGRSERRGELTRSFLLKGVPSVVGSRWDVDSATTSEFMNIFYRALLSGQSIALSLHAAEAALRAQPATEHPYYWAAFSEFRRQ